MELKVNIGVLMILIFRLLLVGAYNGSGHEKQSKQREHNLCEICTTLVDSFLKGMDQTTGNSYEGGDTAWEEKTLGAYATSGVRLLEIQEHLCEEEETRDMCLLVAEMWEEHLERWWHHDRQTYPDLRRYLCQDTVRCCHPSECAAGWTKDSEGRCVDVDECSDSPCRPDEFCVNKEGSYACHSREASNNDHGQRKTSDNDQSIVSLIVYGLLFTLLLVIRLRIGRR